jgi:hypothetical protein
LKKSTVVPYKASDKLQDEKNQKAAPLAVKNIPATFKSMFRRESASSQ